jgi:hypothetical protein
MAKLRQMDAVTFLAEPGKLQYKRDKSSAAEPVK